MERSLKEELPRLVVERPFSSPLSSDVDSQALELPSSPSLAKELIVSLRSRKKDGLLMLNLFRLSKTEDDAGGSVPLDVCFRTSGTSVPSNEAALRGCMSFSFLRSVSTGLRRIFGTAGCRGGVEPLRVIVEEESSLSARPRMTGSITLIGDGALEVRLDACNDMLLSLGAEVDKSDIAGAPNGDGYSEAVLE